MATDPLSNELKAIFRERGKPEPAQKVLREIELGGGLRIVDRSGRAWIDLQAVDLIRRFLDPGDTMVDVGAGIGAYSIAAGAAVGPAGRVEAFEPSPSLRPALEANLRLNEIANVQIHANLAGDGRRLDLFVDGTGHSGRRRWSVRREGVAQRDLLRITSLPVDALMSGRRCNLIRIGVAGGELKVLDGAVKLLGRPEAPAVLIGIDEEALADFGHIPSQLVAWLAARGHEIYAYDGERHRLLQSSAPWRLGRLLLTFPPAARNDVSRRLARLPAGQESAESD
jgi:FkbM family methyltransferase